MEGLTTNNSAAELSLIKWKEVICLECLGVKFGLRSNKSKIISKIKSALPDILPIKYKEISDEQIDYWFSVVQTRKAGSLTSLYKNSDLIISSDTVERLWSSLESQIRMTIAEFAENFVFLHAGVVGWKGQAVIIPGKSFAGKTTLVAELIKNDFEYFSDEYAVIDKNGLVHPFPKKLSLRGIIDDYQQVDIGFEELGGRSAAEPAPVGIILITEFKKNARKPIFNVESSGEGMMSSMANSISVRNNPRLVLEVLSKVIRNSIVIKTERGEARKFIKLFLKYLAENKDSQETI